MLPLYSLEKNENFSLATSTFTWMNHHHHHHDYLSVTSFCISLFTIVLFPLKRIHTHTYMNEWIYDSHRFAYEGVSIFQLVTYTHTHWFYFFFKKIRCSFFQKTKQKNYIFNLKKVYISFSFFFNCVLVIHTWVAYNYPPIKNVFYLCETDKPEKVFWK